MVNSRSLYHVREVIEEPKPKKTVVLYQWLCRDANSGNHFLQKHTEMEPGHIFGVILVKRLDETKMVVEVEE